MITRDKIEFLADETGAPLEEVELALSLANYDTEGALQILHDKMKDVFVLKVKLLRNNPALYGLILAIAKVTAKKPKPGSRLRVVLSENPHLYESDLSMHWYDFEKAIHRARLSEWSHVSLSQHLEKSWGSKILAAEGLAQKIKAVRNDPAAAQDFAKWLIELLPWQGVFGEPPACAIETQILSLSEFHKSPTVDDAGTEAHHALVKKPVNNNDEGDQIHLNLRIALANGVTNTTYHDVEEKPVSELEPGDLVFAYILEKRESCLYLAELVGAFNENGLMAVEVPVESVWREDPFVGVRVRFGFSAVGECVLPATLKVNVVKQAGLRDSWFRRFLRKIDI
ncbi:MAG: hypothetical protein AABZ44_03750 [Elusimicrobiota bacterium]